MIEPLNKEISIIRQCELLGISRSGYYYEPIGESEFNLMLMDIIDRQYMATPFYGVARMCAVLRRAGHLVNEKRVRRLMRLMGIEAIYPKKHTSISDKEHKKYPYLLKDLYIEHPNQVWAVDITYIRLMTGFLYLVAIMDWYSRYVLSWRLSNTLDVRFCVDTLEDALIFCKPEIFNSDQGSQFTSNEFTNILELNNIAIRHGWQREVLRQHIYREANGGARI